MDGYRANIDEAKKLKAGGFSLYQALAVNALDGLVEAAEHCIPAHNCNVLEQAINQLTIIPSSVKSHNLAEGAADLTGFTDLQKRRGRDVGVSFMPLGLLAGGRGLNFIDC